MSPTKVSAGLLLFRRSNGLEVFLAHPGGPFWINKDDGAWTIPKGEVTSGEDPLAAARRELEEETGLRPAEPFLPLGTIRQKGGKEVHAWACEGDADPAAVVSGHFEMEWPPRSGQRASFPEVDRCEWFDVAAARVKINPAQVELLERLEAMVRASSRAGP